MWATADLNAEPDDDLFAARALEVFGMDLYNPPSAFSRSPLDEPKLLRVEVR